jgi:hypothetical protein
MPTTKKPYPNLDRWYVMSKHTNTAQRGPYKTAVEAIEAMGEDDTMYVKSQNLNTMTIHPRRLDNESV